MCDGAMQALATLRVGASGRAAGSPSTARPARSGRRPFRSPSTSARTSPASRARRTSSSCDALGADEVIDYTREDLTARGPVFDVVIDAVGKYAYHWGKRALKPGGIYVETDLGPHKLETLVMAIASRWLGSRRLKFAAGRRSKADVRFMRELIEAGRIPPGDRSELSARAGRRGAPLRRDLAQDRQRRPDVLTRGLGSVAVAWRPP